MCSIRRPPITAVNPYSTIDGTDTIAGGFGGGQLGYNFQFGSFVLGVETDIQGSDIQGSGSNAIFNPAIGGAPATPISPVCRATIAAPGGVPGGVCAGKSDLDVDWFGTVRGRLGYAWGGTLLYVTGGLAYGGVRSSFGYTDNNFELIALKNGMTTIATGTQGRVSNSATQTGWVAGAGVEYKISPSWSLKGEYQYVDLGSISTGPGETSFNTGGGPVASCSTTFPGCVNLHGHSSDVAFNTVRVGLNYYFNAPPPPLPLK